MKQLFFGVVRNMFLNKILDGGSYTETSIDIDFSILLYHVKRFQLSALYYHWTSQEFASMQGG